MGIINKIKTKKQMKFALAALIAVVAADEKEALTAGTCPDAGCAKIDEKEASCGTWKEGDAEKTGCVLKTTCDKEGTYGDDKTAAKVTCKAAGAKAIIAGTLAAVGVALNAM